MTEFEEYCKLYDERYPDGNGPSMSSTPDIHSENCGCWKCHLLKLRKWKCYQS